MISILRKIERILRRGHATFDTIGGKVLCDAVAAGQLAFAFKTAKPKLDFPKKVVWKTKNVF